MPGLGEKFPVRIETISKPRPEYHTDEYYELELPTAPAVMVNDEILAEGKDVDEDELERCIRRHLDLP